MNSQLLERLQEMTPEEFNRWKHHPVTELFLHFLGDQADQDRQTLLAMWQARNLTLDKADEIRGRVAVMEELRELTIEAMKGLYGLEPVQKAE